MTRRRLKGLQLAWQRALEPARLFTIGVKLVAELRMGDLDQGFGALANGAAMQVRDAEFGYYVVDRSSRSDHARAGIEHRHDAGNGAALCGCRHRDNRLAALTTGRAANEVHLSSNAAVEG